MAKWKEGVGWGLVLHSYFWYCDSLGSSSFQAQWGLSGAGVTSVGRIVRFRTRDVTRQSAMWQDVLQTWTPQYKSVCVDTSSVELFEGWQWQCSSIQCSSLSERAIALFEGFQALPASPSGKSSIRWWVWSRGGLKLTRGKLKWAEKYLPPCHSVTQNCYMYWPRSELGSARWEAEPWRGVWELAFLLHMGLLGRLWKEVKGFMRTCNFMFCTGVKLGVTLTKGNQWRYEDNVWSEERRFNRCMDNIAY